MMARDFASERTGRALPFAYGIVVAVTAIVYLNALQTPFIYDDHRTVTENFSIRDFRDWQAVLLFQPLRPVLNVSYAIDYAIWGANPFGFHLTNVLLHIANVLLLFRIAGGLGVIGFTTALLFAIHPMMTSAVTYVSGRSEVLCATFFLAALISARRGLIDGGRRWWILTTSFWLLALATKEIAVMFPIVVLGYERFVLR